MRDKTDTGENQDLSSLEDVLTETVDIDAFRSSAWSSWEVAAEFWRVPTSGSHLTTRMRELVLIGLNASITTFNTEAVERHVERARAAGATDAEIIDVLITIVALANHALYFSIPILEEELEAAGQGSVESAGLDPAYEAAKQEFIKARGFWNADRDALARLIPGYYAALDALSKESWTNGPLTAKERAFVCIGVDSSVTHNFEPGLRRHIRNALSHGASQGEILEVFQLAGMLGLESYILGARVLNGRATTNLAR